MKHIGTEARKWAELGTLVLTGITATSAYGEDHTRCEQAYLESGLIHQQVSFEHFRKMYSDSICAQGDHLAARHELSIPRGEVGAM